MLLLVPYHTGQAADVIQKILTANSTENSEPPPGASFPRSTGPALFTIGWKK